MMNNTACPYHEHIDCAGGSCYRCGWNPHEHERVVQVYRLRGMDAVRHYLAARTDALNAGGIQA